MNKMKTQRLPVFLILALIYFLTACEDVIKLDLTNSPSRTVIEATINASKGECTVQVSKSVDFYQTDSFARVEKATVQLVSGTGAVQNLPELSPGTYWAGNLFVSPEEVFHLNVMMLYLVMDYVNIVMINIIGVKFVTIIMKNDEIYNKWKKFINDVKYAKYFV